MCLEELLELGICGKDGEVGLFLEVAWDGRWRWWLWYLRFDEYGWCWRVAGMCGFVFFKA
jgi:hypothetical protein